MYFNPNNGKMMFENIFEMYYNLFNEIGLSINDQNYLYDQDTGLVLKYKDKFIKATVNPTPIYAGRNDVIFDPAKNYNLMTSIFGYYIDKESHNPECNFKFVAQYIDDNDARDKQRFVVRTKKTDIFSEFYYNVYLAYIEMIFILSGYNVDLSNFDMIDFGD